MKGKGPEGYWLFDGSVCALDRLAQTHREGDVLKQELGIRLLISLAYA